MFLENLQKYEIILASQSPRRLQLLADLGLEFKVQSMNVAEDFPDHLGMNEVPVYLAELKATAFLPQLKDNQLVITADTIVWLDGHVLNKPSDYQDAYRMLSDLSGKKHQVITGVAVVDAATASSRSDSVRTDVRFVPLTEQMIDRYVATGEPLDKAGAYGIQGHGALLVEGIRGDYNNVVGLPVRRLAELLGEFGYDAFWMGSG
jgi:septum formation protein